MVNINRNNETIKITDIKELKSKEKQQPITALKAEENIPDKQSNKESTVDFKKLNTSKVNPNELSFSIKNKSSNKLNNNYPKNIIPAPSPHITQENLDSLKKDFPKIYECINKLSEYSKHNELNIMTLKKGLKIPQDGRVKLNFQDKWCNSLLSSLSTTNTKEQKVFIDNLKNNFSSKVIKSGLDKANNEPILNEFKGNKKLVFKDFLESYYTDPILLSGLNSSSNLSYLSGSYKNLSQTFTSNTEDSNTKENFGSCQDLQRRVGTIMEENEKFTDLFEVIKYKQLLGLHNYVIIKDLGTQKDYQIDPWYTQKLENSIKVRDFIH